MVERLRKNCREGLFFDWRLLFVDEAWETTVRYVAFRSRLFTLSEFEHSVETGCLSVEDDGLEIYRELLLDDFEHSRHEVENLQVRFRECIVWGNIEKFY